MQDRLRGVLLGTAVGDALGLPWEGMGAGAIRSRIGPETEYRLLGGRGLLSDDTEHSYLLGCALLAGRQEPVAVRDGLARMLGRWLLALPPGIGFGTLRALLRLLVGVSPERSGTLSAGNGAAMRTALIGVVCPREAILPLVQATSAITHRDERAVDGAFVIALAAWLGAHRGREDRAAQARELLAEIRTPELRANVQLAVDHALEGRGADAFQEALGVPGFVTGYVNHSVPAAIFLWLRHDDFEAAMAEAVRMGGDTDSVGAMAGALLGATLGAGSIPERWVAGLGDAPLTRERLVALADALADGETGGRAHGLPWGWFLLRNLGMVGVVVCHVFWRRLPRLPRLGGVGRG